MLKYFRKLKVQESRPRRLLLWAAAVSLLFGVGEVGTPLENAMDMLRDRLRDQPVSGDIVVVGIDGTALNELGSWPWPKQRYADLATRLDQAGAARIFFSFEVDSSSATGNNTPLTRAFSKLRAEVFMPANFDIDSASGRKTEYMPSSALRDTVSLVNGNLWIDNLAGVKTLPYANQVAGEKIPSFAAKMANVAGGSDAQFPVDYAYNSYSIPYLSVSETWDAARLSSMVRGKDVIIGPNEDALELRIPTWGKGRLSRVFIHVYGAETLKQGIPVQLGWFLPLVLALALGATCLHYSHRRFSNPLLGAGFVGILLCQLLLDGMAIKMTTTPALFALSVIAGMIAWHRYGDATKAQSATNQISGLPNLNALRQAAERTDYCLVAAKVHNFVEATTALPYEYERELVDQIAKRLAFGTAGSTLYHGDEGLFLWLVPPEEIDSIGDQLIALHAIFHSPVQVAGRKLDLSITFGVDADAERKLQNRLSGAVLASQQAHENGEKWKAYDSSRLEATEWKISMMGEMDAAIDNGEIWVAYQPKLDLKTDLVCGAEALVRWTHPEKGTIDPSEFVLAAEKHDRIEKLTQYVLERAVAVALAIITRDHDINMSVNLSPRMLNHKNLETMLTETSWKYGLPLDFLMLEITETAAMANSTEAIAQMERIRDMGVQLSIDDYGTGYSTLEYLKKCPASEVKIDRSFISNLTRNRSDRIMVNSTIELAHSLGQTVVAEGVEDSETLELLRQMGCDKVQGFLIGRPMDRASFSRYVDLKNRPAKIVNG